MNVCGKYDEKRKIFDYLNIKFSIQVNIGLLECYYGRMWKKWFWSKYYKDGYWILFRLNVEYESIIRYVVKFLRFGTNIKKLLTNDYKH